MLWFVSWYLIKDIHKSSCVLRQVSWNVPNLDTNTHKEHCGKKTFGCIIVKLPSYCNCLLLRYVFSSFVVLETDSTLNSHRHLMIQTCQLTYVQCTQYEERRAPGCSNTGRPPRVQVGTKTHLLLLHNNNSSLSALHKGGGEEGSFTITSRRAPRAVFSTAHVFTGVLATRQEEAVNACIIHTRHIHTLLYVYMLLLYILLYVDDTQ